MSIDWRGRCVAAFVTGSTLNLSFAPFGWWPVAVFAPAVLFVLIRGVPRRRAAWMGAAFGVGFFAFGTYWLYTCIHIFGLVPIWLTFILQAGLVSLMAFYIAALCYIANRFWLESAAIRDWLVLPALWVLLEWLRGWLLSGFPWLSIGYAFIDSPLAAIAPVFGVYGVTFAAALAAVALSVLWSRTGTRQRWLPLGVLAALFVVAILGAREWTHAVGHKISVAAVQGAVSQDEKWQENNREATLIRYSHLTTSAWGAQLIVWPEAALPVLASDIQDYLQALQAAGRRHGAEFAIGLLRYQPDTEEYRNGLLVLSDSGNGWYYKRRLVPFGEFFPVPPFVRTWMRLRNLPYSDMTPGEENQPVLRAAGQKLGLTICYEDAYGAAQLKVLREATLLINITNNAWYGDSTAPHQHLQIARMRALEAGRYLVRAANDGITAVIGPRGEIVARLPQFQQAVLRADVQPMTGLTPYARVGNYPVVIGALLMLFVAVWKCSVVRRRARA